MKILLFLLGLTLGAQEVYLSLPAAIDAALQLQGKHFFRPEDIAGILVETYDVGVLQCGFEKYPQSPVEAKFSIAFTCAVAFVYGSVTVGAFCQAVLDNPQVKRIAKATKVISSDLFTQRYPKRWGSRMTVTLLHSDGTSESFEAAHTYNEQQIGWFKAGSALNVKA